jgi:hypothetical protein
MFRNKHLLSGDNDPDRTLAALNPGRIRGRGARPLPGVDLRPLDPLPESLTVKHRACQRPGR